MASPFGYLALLAVAAPAAASPFPGQSAVSDAELATMRGGIMLPNGLSVAIGISVETRIDGALALRTSISTEQPGVVVATGGSRAAPDGTMVAVSLWTPPEIVAERERAGTTVTSAPATAVTFTLGGGAAPATDGTPLPLTPGGGAAATSFGEVRLASSPGGFVTTLIGPTIEIRQLVGQSTGIVVGNTANDRAIDTVAYVNVDLSNAGTILNNFGSQVEAAMLAAARRN